MPEIRNITFSYLEYELPSELEMEDQELIEAAKKAAGNAYAPYSGFLVGAAVRLGSGKIVIGSNVENAAFPSGICAERTALSSAVSNYPGDSPAAIAIAAMNGNSFCNSGVSPCGNCRQVIAEEEFRTGKKIKVLLYGTGKILVIQSISDLLPIQFSQESFKPFRP